jgi:hypothetical protein
VEAAGQQAAQKTTSNRVNVALHYLGSKDVRCEGSELGRTNSSASSRFASSKKISTALGTGDFSMASPCY